MIDTHIHLDEEAYAPDREEVIARQREAGVEAMIVPGVKAESIEAILDVCHHIRVIVSLLWVFIRKR